MRDSSSTTNHVAATKHAKHCGSGEVPGAKGGLPRTPKTRALIPKGVNSFLPRYAMVLTAILPEMVKPAVLRKEMNRSTGGVSRGGWRERVSKERLRHPGYPFRCSPSRVGGEQRRRGNHNPVSLRQRKSDWLIVAKKRGSACGAKAPDRISCLQTEGSAA